MPTLETLFAYIDFLWIPVALLTVPKNHWLGCMAFILCCALVMRLQIELMTAIDYPLGFFSVITMPLFQRLIITYSLFIGGFVILSSYSKASDAFVYIAASITILIMAFCVSSLVMVL